MQRVRLVVDFRVTLVVEVTFVVGVTLVGTTESMHSHPMKSVCMRGMVMSVLFLVTFSFESLLNDINQLNT